MQKAFSLGSSNILWTLVNNSQESTQDPKNPYCCENTKDKVFLLSYAEAMSKSFGFKYFSDRMGVYTDYALARGIYPQDKKCSWWLRSPAEGGRPSNDALHINFMGFPSYYRVNCTDVAIRPVIQIKL